MSDQDYRATEAARAARQAERARESRRELAESAEREVAALREQLATAQRERDEAITILRPSMPESGLVDACKQRMQVLIVALDNEKKAMELYDQQRERADRLVAALEGVAPRRFADYGPCWCPGGTWRGPHSSRCLETSAALRGEPTALPAHPPTTTACTLVQCQIAGMHVAPCEQAARDDEEAG